MADIDNLNPLPFSPLPVATNLFYIVPMICSFILGWNYLAFFHLSVVLTSGGYHLCENTSICIFGWSMLMWRSLDHVVAWYALALTLIYCFNSENFPHKMLRNKKQVITKYIFIDRFSFYAIFIDFLQVILLIQIIYFSFIMVNAEPVPQIVMTCTLVFGIIFGRIVFVISYRYISNVYLIDHIPKKIYHYSYILDVLCCNGYYDDKADVEKNISIKSPNNTIPLEQQQQSTSTSKKEYNNCNHCFPPFNAVFLWASFLAAIIALAGFYFYDDPDGILHSMWHMFGGLGGALLLLAVYYQ
jgi:hypothetical protein